MAFESLGTVSQYCELGDCFKMARSLTCLIKSPAKHYTTITAIVTVVPQKCRTH